MNNQILNIEKISKYYETNLVLNEVSLTLNRTDRIALVGENGVGKTTLAKIITGQTEAGAGQLHFAPDVEVGYLPQEVSAEAEEGVTIDRYLRRAMGRLDTIASEMERLETQMASGELDADELAALLKKYGQLQETFESRGGYNLDHHIDQVLGGLGLSRMEKTRPMETLSGGERTRTALAALLLRSPDLLILDEPTNHLDFEALEWLEVYLAGYANCLLAISHDRQFLNKVVNQIVELSPVTHQAAVFHGNYDDYLQENERLQRKQMDAFWEQQQQIKDLKREIKARSHSTAKARPPSDRDKFIYNAKKATSEKTARHTIRAAKKRLENLLENRIEPKDTGLNLCLNNSESSI